MREPMFRQKTNEEGTGWTINNRAGCIATGVAVVVLVITAFMIDAAIEDRIISALVTVGFVMLWAVAFTFFAKWESERP